MHAIIFLSCHRICALIILRKLHLCLQLANHLNSNFNCSCMFRVLQKAPEGFRGLHFCTLWQIIDVTWYYGGDFAKIFLRHKFTMVSKPHKAVVGKIFLLIIAHISTLKMAQFPVQYAIDAPGLYFEKEKFWKKSILNYLLTIETYSLTNKCGARKFSGLNNN